MKRSAKTAAWHALIYSAAWLPLLALYTLGMRAASAPNLPTAIQYAVTYLVPGFLAGAAAWSISGRLPWNRWSRWAASAAQGAITLATVAVWSTGFLALLYAVGGPAVVRSVSAQTSRGWALGFDFLIAGLQAAIFHILRVTRRAREQERAALEADRLRARAEMDALRGQLDPHFLFNSLHSITALVRSNPPQAEEALLQFSGLLRKVLEAKRESADETTVGAELQFVDDYLSIERLRLGERLTVTPEVSAAAKACWLPHFTLQPLVENAIKHAVAARRQGGHITIRAAVSGGSLLLEVADDGPGADPGQIDGAAGLGLKAIRRRLELRYGAAATLGIITRPGAGFRVQIRVPAELAPLLAAAP